MRGVPNIGLTLTQAVNIVAALLLGAMTAAWVGAVFGDIVPSFPRSAGIALAVAVGATAGLLPWGISAATTPRSQILLLYLTTAAMTGVAGAIAIAGTVHTAALLGVPTITAFLAGGLYVRLPSPDHRVFVAIWLGLLASFSVALFGFARTVRTIDGLLPGFVIVCFALLLAGTHQVLIDERGAQIT